MNRKKYWKIKWGLIRHARRLGLNLKFSLPMPAACITGSVGKTTTCRMVARILAESGKKVALTTTQGSYIGQELIRRGDSSDCKSASRLLLDTRAQAGVFELARGGLIKQGMVLGACDVGAVLNVYDNHLGLNGIQTRKDMARVKGAVAQSAKRLAVLNADDALCLEMRERIVAPKVCLVSMRPDNPPVLEHLSDGGLAAFIGGDKDPELKLYEGRIMLGSMPVSAIPATFGGIYRPAVFNALFAMAIAHGLEVEFRVIRDALKKFRSTHESNPGRMNHYDGLPYRLIITWADGPQATSELGDFVDRLEIAGKKILMLSAVGNRPDCYLRDMAGSVAAAFTHYVCSDWEDLRGRQKGVVAGLLAQGLREGGVPQEKIELAQTYEEALKRAFSLPGAGDLLVIVSLSGGRIKDLNYF